MAIGVTLSNEVDLALKVDTLRRGEPHRRCLTWTGVILTAVAAIGTAIANLFTKYR